MHENCLDGSIFISLGLKMAEAPQTEDALEVTYVCLIASEGLGADLLFKAWQKKQKSYWLLLTTDWNLLFCIAVCLCRCFLLLSYLIL